MGQNGQPDKVIPFGRPRSGTEKATQDESLPPKHARPKNTRVIAITSGKGGVGKTNIVANLGYALGQMGQRVLILDADLGLGNLDILLGVVPPYNLSNVIMGDKEIPEILVEGPGNLIILPASSGIQELTRLTSAQKIRIFTELDDLLKDMDVLLIDTAAGISSNVMDFNVSAQEIMVVVTPEPTAITDAYALMKVLSLRYSERHCKLLVNQCGSHKEAEDVYRQLNLVAEKFLDISIEYCGCVFSDENVTKCVRRQKIVSEVLPNSRASKCYVDLAKRMLDTPVVNPPKGETNFFWKHLVENQPR